MQNAFISRFARLLAKSATAEAVAVETPAEVQTLTPTRNREDSTPDAPLTQERDPLHPENQPRAILTQTNISTRAKLGSFARPRTVYASRLSGCPYGCAGALLSHGHGLYECQDCRTWWTLRPLDADLVAELGTAAGAVEDPQVTRPTSAVTTAPPDGLCPGCLNSLSDQGCGALWCATCRRWFKAGPDADDRADDPPPALFDSGAVEAGWVM
ncbi:MAG: hypothetical protein ACREAM_07395 [Blastocatellia bacterium]